MHCTLHTGLPHSWASPVSPIYLYSYFLYWCDWGGCPDTRRSTSGYCVFVGDDLLTWSAKRQPILSRSSAEVEHRGVANVVYESCWLHNFFS